MSKHKPKETRIALLASFFLYATLVVLILVNDMASFLNYWADRHVINGIVLCVIFFPFWYLIYKKYFYLQKNAIDKYDICFIIIIFGLTIIKLPFPDTNFDTLNYHLFLQWAGFVDNLNQNLLPSGLGSYLLPLGDRVFYLFRIMLGYRAGTILNSLIFILMYFQIKRLILLHMQHQKLRKSYLSLLCILILSTEFLLLNLSVYMIDLLFIPFLLEALNMILYPGDYQSSSSCYFSFLLGIAVAIKFTSFIFGIIFLIVYLIQNRKQINALTIVLSVFIGILPVSMYLFFNYMETGNPIFPLYNSFFQSPYYPIENFKDLRWSPKSLYEYIVWVFYVLLYPNRLSELNIYSGRLSIGLLGTIVYLIFFIKSKNLRNRNISLLTILFVISLILWEISTGYIRYALFIEILAGIILVFFILSLMKTDSNGLKMIATAFIMLLSLQVFYSYFLIIIHNADWAWRPSIFTDFNKFSDNVSMIWNDRKDLSPDDREITNNVEALAIADNNSGYGALIVGKDIPIFNLNLGNFEKGAKTQEISQHFMERIATKKIFTIANSAGFESTIDQLSREGYRIVNISSIHPAFLCRREPLSLMEINKNDNPNQVFILKSEPLVLNEDFEGKSAVLSAIVGYHPITYSWGSDGCRLNIDVSDGLKTGRVFCDYLEPYSGFSVISIPIDTTGFSGSRITISINISNDVDKNDIGDWLLVINPLFERTGITKYEKD